MSKVVTKILFITDTHLGFDYPIKPKIIRRRRGDDFFNNYHKALEPAFNGEVSAVIHGGDMFFKSKVHQSIVTKAFEPLIKIADSGIPVLIVPGNHERSFLPMSLLETHKNILIFDKPRSYKLNLEGKVILFSGFPYQKGDLRSNFIKIVEQTEYKRYKAELKFLCLHHAVEGAVVGTQNYTFRKSKDTIKINETPEVFKAVLAGHIHRAQILKKDLNGNKVNVPVIFGGSTEKTAFAERLETKSYTIIEVYDDNKIRPIFIPLYSRPMIDIHFEEIINNGDVENILIEKLSKIQKDSIVRIKVDHDQIDLVPDFLTSKYLRELAPAEMNIELSIRNRFKKKEK